MSASLQKILFKYIFRNAESDDETYAMKKKHAKEAKKLIAELKARDKERAGVN